MSAVSIVVVVALTAMLAHLEPSLDFGSSPNKKMTREEDATISVRSKEELIASNRRNDVSKDYNKNNKSTVFLAKLAMKLRFMRLAFVCQVPLLVALLVMLISDELFYQVKRIMRLSNINSMFLTLR